MWKIYINQINLIKNNNLKEYTLEYSKLFNLPLYSFEETHNILSNFAYDLFPERKIFSECLNSGTNLELLLSCFYYWEELDWTWLFISQKKIAIEEAFDEKNPLYFYKTIGFSPEMLLSKSEDNRTLTYLYLYFLPTGYIHNLLYHYDNQQPLLIYSQISFEHFQMLLFLMQEYDHLSFQSYCSSYNLNYLILEDFINHYKDFDDLSLPIAWNKILPLPKFNILFEYGCSFKILPSYQKEKYIFTLEDLFIFLDFLEKEYLKNRLDRILYKKNKDNIKKEISKI